MNDTKGLKLLETVVYTNNFDRFAIIYEQRVCNFLFSFTISNIATTISVSTISYICSIENPRKILLNVVSEFSWSELTKLNDYNVKDFISFCWVEGRGEEGVHYLHSNQIARYFIIEQSVNFKVAGGASCL